MSKIYQEIAVFGKRFYFILLDGLCATYWLFRGLFANKNINQYQNPPKPRRSAVVMIPGVYESWQFMKPLSVALYAHGYPVYVIEGLGYNTGKVPDMAEIVRQYLTTLDCQQFVLVTHSKGGLIGKYLLAEHNQDDRIKHMIALNTPFPGSKYALYVPMRSLRLFSPKDALLLSLQANKAINNQITSIYSAYDLQIPNSSYLEDATNVQIDSIGHWRIVANKKVHTEVLNILDDMEAIPNRRHHNK
jgi:triacylglycerol lipase